MENLNKEMISFWRKFATMLSSGVPLLRVLDACRQEARLDEVREALAGLAQGIREGSNLSAAAARFPAVFPVSVQTMIKAGEAGGVLDVISERIANGLEKGAFEADETAASLDNDELEPASDDAPPAIRAANEILLEAIGKEATDIHIDWLSEGMRVRLRIDGVLKEITPPPADHQKALIGRLKLMAALDVAEKRMPQDGRIILEVKGKKIDIRVSTGPSITGESMVMRILDSEKVNLDIEKLWLTDTNLKTLRNWIRRPNGTIIVTGPTGAGKTTTIYSALNDINTEGIKIITVEDPVEYQIDGITQMPLNPRIGMTIPRAARSMLRQDPDVLMICEIRDQECAHLVCAAGLTGHLVFTTLHTNDSVSAIRRLMDIGIEPFLVNSTLIGVVSQRLVRRICPDCKAEHKHEWINDLGPEYAKAVFYKGKGCKKCNGTGYRGRAAIHELLDVDNKLKSIIAQNADTDTLRAKAIELGLITLRQDGLAKAQQGLTTIEEVLRATQF